MKRASVSLLFVIGCAALGRPERTVPTEGVVHGPILEAVTYNLGLAPGVEPYASPRIKPLAHELGKLRDVGVMCLQEVWTKEAKEAIVAELALPPENVFYSDTTGQGDDLSKINVCKPGQLDGVASCMRTHCTGLPDEEQSRCGREQCMGALVSLYGLTGSGENCLNCLVASVGKPFEGALKTCATPGQGVTHVYDGQNGQMLISRFPLAHTEAILLPSSIANRAALFATIELEGHESIEVACMHSATSNQVPPSHRGSDGKRTFSDWNDEMIGQVDIVSKRLKERAGNRPQLLLGDLNTGPGLGHDVTEDEPRVWSRIVSLGFTSPATQADHPFCSVCSDNTQRQIENPNPGNHLIDHVLVRDPPGGSTLIPVNVRRMFDADHLVYYRGYDGQLVEGHLSDHYAVAVSFHYE